MGVMSVDKSYCNQLICSCCSSLHRVGTPGHRGTLLGWVDTTLFLWIATVFDWCNVESRVAVMDNEQTICNNTIK